MSMHERNPYAMNRLGRLLEVRKEKAFGIVRASICWVRCAQQKGCCFMTSQSIATKASQENTRDRFQRLARDWKEQSKYLSNTAQMSMLRPYQQIIGMGEARRGSTRACGRSRSGWCARARRSLVLGPGDDYGGKSSACRGRRKGPANGSSLDRVG
jgi:hypothetical protein